MAVTDVLKNQTEKTTTQFFNRYYNETVSYNTNEVDAIIGYFLKRGFEETAAVSVSVILLQQAKQDQVSVFELIDTLKGTSDVELSNIITQILNSARSKSSSLGFAVQDAGNVYEKRNIRL